MQGNSQGWFPSGQIQFDYNFKDNLEHGVCTEWNENGIKVSEIHFENGLAKKKIVGPNAASLNVIKAQNQTGVNKQPKKILPKKPVDSPKVNPKVEKKKMAPVHKPADSSPSGKKPKESTLPAAPNRSEAEQSTDTPSASVEVLPEASTSNTSANISVETSAPATTDSFSPAPQDVAFPAPPENSAPFDPFSDLPSSNEEAVGELESSKSASQNPFENPPPPSSAVDPFDTSPAEDPFAVPPPPEPPASFDPFGDIPPPPTQVPSSAPEENSLDPFGNNPLPDGDDSETQNVPLGDIFGNPPESTTTEDNLPQSIPEPPPPPPTFDPFAE